MKSLSDLLYGTTQFCEINKEENYMFGSFGGGNNCCCLIIIVLILCCCCGGGIGNEGGCDRPRPY